MDKTWLVEVLKKTKAGTYKIHVDVGRDPITGKRKRHVETLRTKREAERRVNEVIQQMEMHTYTLPNKELFGEFMKVWLEAHTATEKRKRAMDIHFMQGVKYPVQASYFSLCGLFMHFRCYTIHRMLKTPQRSAQLV